MSRGARKPRKTPTVGETPLPADKARKSPLTKEEQKYLEAEADKIAPQQPPPVVPVATENGQVVMPLPKIKVGAPPHPFEPKVFQQDEVTMRARREIAPGMEWVREGKGVPTLMVDGWPVWVRFEPPDMLRMFRFIVASPGMNHVLGAGWEEIGIVGDLSPEADPKILGWLPVLERRIEARAYVEAWVREADVNGNPFQAGLYTLTGPRVNGGADSRGEHVLEPYGMPILQDVPNPVTFEAMRAWFAQNRHVYGVRWMGPNGMRGQCIINEFGVTRTRPRNT